MLFSVLSSTALLLPISFPLVPPRHRIVNDGLGFPRDWHHDWKDAIVGLKTSYPLQTEPYYDTSTPMTYEELVDFLEHKMSMSVMQNAQNNANSNEYRSVPISILVESATNPRKRFDEKNLEELAASMKAQGILAPLLVRELEESKYEVVAGARRLRAAKLAELETVPVRVVKLTDAESIEAQVVELSVVGKIFLC